jgi:hypothetical protein
VTIYGVRTYSEGVSDLTRWGDKNECSNILPLRTVILRHEPFGSKSQMTDLSISAKISACPSRCIGIGGGFICGNLREKVCLTNR